MPARKKLKAADARFRLLFRDNPQPMWVFDRETLAILEVNDAATRLYGYSREELLAMRVTDLRQDKDVPAPVATPAPADRPGQAQAMWRHRVKDGRLIDVEVAAHAIEYHGHKAMLAVLIDATLRKQLEERLLQSQKMEAVGMLAGGIAHDFNNLLTIITGYSQLLLSSIPESDRNRSAIEQIMKAGDRAAALTRQLLAFSRRQVMQPKVLDLNLLVNGMAVMLRRLIGEDIELRLDLRKELGRVHADPGQVEQVIMNLVVNARDAMPKGGILTVETANTDLDASYTKPHIAVKPGAYIMLAVSDNGTGMDEGTRAHLFEPFFTTKGQGRGTGLGLSTVFGIVRQSGGNVEVYSEPGTGTSVKLYFPRVDQPATVEADLPAATASRGSETILVVEDEEMVRKLVVETLRIEGYQVLEASGPEEARCICKVQSGPIHLMITDVVMPKESGHTLARKLGRLRPLMKVLFMSGYTDSAVVNSGVLDSENEFLQKPFTPGALTRKVREVLEGRSEKYRRAGDNQ
jgi:two-component system cell cycle sensor histidine kinase/response regulator CckA